FSVGEINFQIAAKRRFENAASAVSKIPAERAERGKNAIDAQLQAARIGRSVKVGLVGNAVFAHARGHSCIQAYARGQPVVGIFANECRRDGGLPRLNLVSTGI